MSNYTAYHVHTEDSLLDSCTNYKLYADKAAELGQKALAITEHGNIYNWIEKKMYINSKGLKYIHGVECYLTESLEEKVRDNYHTILLAKNYEGVKEINLLIEKSTRPDHTYYKPRITFEEFLNISDNVIKISACLASPLHNYPNDIEKSIREKTYCLQQDLEDTIKQIETKRKDEKEENNWIISYTKSENEDYNIDDPNYVEDPWITWNCTPHEAYIKFVDNEVASTKTEYEKQIKAVKMKNKTAREIFHRLLKTYDYYEIQPHDHPEQRKYNEFLYRASLQTGKPLIAGTDTHSINYYKAECRSILQKAKGIEYADEDKFDLTYKSYDELVDMFRKQGCGIPFDAILQAIENTNVMADSVEDFELDTSVKYPKLYDNEEEVLKKRIVRMLKEKVDKGIIDRKKLPEYKKRIAEEMRVFKKINMVGFMLFMSELVCWCWDHGIPVGPCRGSVGGSTIAYITDIIDVDPIVWNTIFSRFANEDREEVGDIDLDISPDQRELVYNHIIESFGYDKTAYILAIGTISDKGTIDEIGRALDIPLAEVAHIKLLYSTYKDAIDSTAKRIKEIEEIPHFDKIESAEKDSEYYSIRKDYERKKTEHKKAVSQMQDLKENQYRQLFYYFDGLNGTAVSQSMHPAGIVVSPITLPDNYGIFWNDGKQIICINMEEIHDGAGLVKYDILGLKNLQIIRKCYEYVGKPYPKSHQINWNDKKVWDDIIISPAGIFQFESAYAFEMLKNYKPQCVNDLSMINASLRPSGASYRDRLLAGEINKNPSPLIDDLLKDNRGFLIFQEDVIAFLQKICGLSGSEADNVRRAIGRKQMDRLQKALPDILDGYCKMSPQSRDIAEKEAKTFLQIIEDSSNYMFGFNHSTGYSMIGYMCALCRYYYPEEFIASYLNCANNTDDIIMGTELAKIKHVAINNIQFGKSGPEYTVDKPNHALYKGIASIKFCNAIIAYEMLDLAHNNSYKDFTQLLGDIDSKTSVNSRQLTILTGLNFFSEFGNNKYLMNVTNIYNKLATAKIISKKKLEELGLTEFLMKKYAGRETASQYRDLDNEGLIFELASRLEDKPMSVVEQVKFEKEYLQYVVYSNPRVNHSFYIVTDYKTFKEVRKPYCTLHNIKTGEDIKTRVTSVKTFENNPFGEYSILRVDRFTKKHKKKCINGTWQETEELEDILDNYEVIRNE